ncbi:MAG TPA: hypothetical protein PK402_04270, partial [Tepidisphaeraceae bacterium]|nr:hypothetical protein [Tepidisphaeraceae bacterium]
IPLLSSAILAGNNALGSFTKFLGAGSSGLKGMADQFFGARMRVGTFKATLETLGPSLKSLGRTGLLGAAVPTVAAFSAVLVRNITHQESWRESAFRTARSAGLFKDAVTEFGVAMEDMGATARGIMEVEEKLRNASTIETNIRLQQELNELLHQQLLRMQQIDKLEGTQSTNTPWWAQLAGGAMMAQGNASGGVMMDAMFGDPVTLDAGINDKRLDAFDKKIAEGEKRLEALRAARDKQTGTGGEFDFGENPLGPTAAAPIEPETPAIIERTKEAMEELASGQLVGVEAGTLFRQTFETLKASLASGEINAIQFNEAWKQLTDGLAAGEAKIASDALEKFNSTMLDIEDQIFALNNSEIDVKVREFARTDGITDEQVDQYRKGLEKLETAKAKFNQDDTGLDAFAASLDTGPSLLEAGSAEAEHFRARLAVADQQMQSIAPAPQTAVASAAPVAEQDTAQLTSEIKTALTGPKSERAIQEKALKVATDSLAVLKKLAERDDGPIQVISF